MSLTHSADSHSLGEGVSMMVLGLISAVIVSGSKLKGDGIGLNLNGDGIRV